MKFFKKTKLSGGEATSTSMVLWIAIAVAVVIILASFVLPPLIMQGEQARACLDPETGVNARNCPIIRDNLGD
jgi:hypothetical protein